MTGRGRRQLVVDGRPVAPVDVADTFWARLRGLIGRDELDGALLLKPANAVHTFGVRICLDVAFLDADGLVVHTTGMQPNRLGRPILRARAVLEAAQGSFHTWQLTPGSAVTTRGRSDKTEPG